MGSRVMDLTTVCHVVTTMTVVLLAVAVTSFGLPVNKNGVIAVVSSPWGSMTSPSTLTQEFPRGEGVVEEDNDDDVITTGDEDFSVHRNAVRNRTRRWPGGIVPYVIDKAYPDAARASILEALAEIEADVASNGSKCIQFVNRTTEANYLEISLGVGCHSYIGFTESDNGAVVSTLGPGCEKKGIVMHEILHILGFFHEQNRLDRDLYVDINETNIAKARDFDIRNETEIDDLGVPYDLDSIMHYGAYHFAQDYGYPVMSPKPEYAPGQRLGQRVALTARDVLKIQRLYGCPEDTTHVRSDLDDKLIMFCDFAFGTCNFTHTNPNDAADSAERTSNTGHDALAAKDLKWTVKLGPVDNGPWSGYSNGIDPFLFAAKGEDDGQTVAVTSITTPALNTQEAGGICISLQLYQQGPSSFYSLYILGPSIPRQPLRIYQGISRYGWLKDEVKVSLVPNLDFQIEFVATLHEGSVSIDDFFVFKHECLNVS
ncbi:unnamed protein product [Lymnaea stagnalis]|uniref:Metalloendopeptidase n=1 Tax=Lymnaea stagnalis TaxID=6523 RepID=A0AAV2ILM4_LYMST